MKTCTGTLVVEKDGTPVWCSADAEGPSCGNHAYERHRTFLSRHLVHEVLGGQKTSHVSARRPVLGRTSRRFVPEQ